MNRKKNNDLAVALIIIAIAAIGAVVVGLLITLELRMIYTLALILVGGSVLALVIMAAAFPIRALRKRDGPHEREIIREKHTVEKDGRRDPRIIMPDRGGGGQEFFPQILRAVLSDGRRRELGYYETDPEEEGREIIRSDDRVWRGRIKDE